MKLCRCGCGEIVTGGQQGQEHKKIYINRAHGKRHRAQKARENICQREGCTNQRVKGKIGYEHLVRYCSSRCSSAAYRDRLRDSTLNSSIPPQLCDCGCGKQTEIDKLNRYRLRFFSERCRMNVENQKSRERRARGKVRGKPVAFVGEIHGASAAFFRNWAVWSMDGVG